MSFEIEILKGLPPYGTPTIGFDQSGQRQLLSEGYVVNFTLNDQSSWVGNFSRGMTKFDYATIHPNGTHALIIAGGRAYIVDPNERKLSEVFGDAIMDAFPHPKQPWIILNNDIYFAAIGPTGTVWQSSRISWDGLKLSPLEGETLFGEAWDAPNQEWASFKLDLNTGVHEGGTYHPETFIPITDKRAKPIIDMIKKMRSSAKKE